MIKILAIGDFHGKLSEKIINKIKKINPDIILSPGDFCGNSRFGKLFFKYAYGKSEEQIPLNIKKELVRLEKLSSAKGKEVIKKLKELNIPTFAIRGNWDPTPYGHDLTSKLKKEDRKEIRKFAKVQSKNFNFIDLRELELENFILVGGVSSTSPQRLKKGMIKKMIKKYDMSKKEAEEYVQNLKKDWKFRQKKYEEIFEKATKLKRETGKKIIFLTHNAPYNTKLDKIKRGPQKGKHYGSYQELLLIKKYQPDFVICGHIHESAGKQNIGKSVIYNIGSVMDGKFITLKI